MKQNKAVKLFWLMVGAVFLASFLFGIYPFIADWWNQKHASQAISSYEKTVVKMDPREVEKELRQAEDFNAKLQKISGIPILDSSMEKQYQSSLWMDSNGMIARLKIPKIHVDLPIYHGSKEEVLAQGTGHLEGTSLPIGEKGDHAAITGHSGLAGSKMMDELDQLKTGDLFMIEVLDQKLYYEVDQINVVKPEEMDLLEREPDKDLVTLITCTPYGINTHRLLVRGHRVPAPKNKKAFEAKTQNFNGLYILIGVLCLLIVVFIVVKRRKKREN